MFNCRPVLHGPRLPPRAESLRAEEEWNVAYHGTAVGNARSILDCGGLLLPGGRGHMPHAKNILDVLTVNQR